MSPVLGLVAMVLAALPFCIEAIRSAATSGYVYLGGDQALIELATRRAVGFHQLVGPYDRFGWAHPGPIYFYLLSIPYRIFGPGARPDFVGEVLIFGAATVAIVGAVFRRAGGWAALASAIWVLLACLMLTPLRVEYPWNPFAVMVPTFLVVVLAAAAMAGSALWLLAAVLVGSFVVQTDISTLPLSAAVIVIAGACQLARFFARSSRSFPPRPSIIRRRVLAGVGMAILIGIWIPPLVQQVNGPGPGNLGTILHFFAHAPPAHVSFAAAATDVAAVDASFAYGAGTIFGRSVSSPHTALVLTIAILVGVAATALGWLRRQPFAASLGVLSLVGLLASIVAVTRIVGGVMGYLILWELAVPVAGLVGLGVAILAPRSPVSGSEPQRRSLAQTLAGTGAAAGALAVAAVLTFQVARLAYPPEDHFGAEVASAWRLASPHLANRHETVLVNMIGSPQFAVGAGLVDRLAGLGFTARVPAVWSVQFGLSAVIHGAPQATILLEPPSARHPAGFVLAGYPDPATAIYYSRFDPGPPARHQLRVAVHALGRNPTNPSAAHRASPPWVKVLRRNRRSAGPREVSV